MNSESILVTVLNKSGPIPNVAAILSHRPRKVLLIDGSGICEDSDLNRNFEIIRHWSEGTLLDLYNFEVDTVLDPSCLPGFLDYKPEINRICIEDIYQDSTVIHEKIELMSSDSNISEICFEVNAGRKEDGVKLTRISTNETFSINNSLWYTDVSTGNCIDISTGEIKQGVEKLSQIDKWWLLGKPVLNISKVYHRRDYSNQLISQTLDSLVEAIRNANQNEDRSNLLEASVISSGLNFGESDIGIEITSNITESFGKIELPKFTLDSKNGLWLENVTSLALMNGFEMETVYCGISLGHSDKNERMGSLRSFLRKGGGKEAIFKITEQSKSILEEEKEIDMNIIMTSFSEEDYSGWLRIKEHESQINMLSEWVVDNWVKLSSNLRGELMRYCANRDLDVFAEGDTPIFIECKLGLSKFGAKVARSQLDSIIHSSGNRGTYYSFLIHNQVLNPHRSSTNQFICNWTQLRNKEEMLEIEKSRIDFNPDKLG